MASEQGPGSVLSFLLEMAAAQSSGPWVRTVIVQDGIPPWERAGSPAAASKASIEAMKAVAGPDEECAVCLEGMVGKEGVREMPCGHRFDGVCIERWLRMNGSCPVCRHRMPAEEESGGKKVGEEESGRRIGVWISIATFESSRRREEID